MVTRQQLEGKWNEVSGRLKEKWGVLTDDDLSRAEGSVERLVGVIQQKTGRGREEVEQFLDSVVSGTKQSIDRLASNAKEFASNAKEYASAAKDYANEYAAQASDAVRRGYEQAEESMAAGYQEAQRVVRRNPVESVAISFGAGLLSGVLVALMLRDRR